MNRRITVLVCIAALAGCNTEPIPSPDGFSLKIIPEQLAPVIPHQQCVLLVRIADDEADQSGGSVTLSATAPDCEVAIEPPEPMPGQVAEVTVVPGDATLNTTVTVTVRGERAGVVQTDSASIDIVDGEDTVAGEAATWRDRFIPWLAANYPELGIASDTAWTGIVVRPVWLVVTHYLFFSEDWEMGVSWHIMIPPYDWTRIYLRHRFDEAQPSYAFEISSRSDDTEEPHAIDLPEEVTR